MKEKEKSIIVTLSIALIVIALFGFNLIRLGGEYTKEKQRSASLQEQLTQVAFNLETKENEIEQLNKELKEAQSIKQSTLNELIRESIKLGWASRGYNGISLEDTLKPFK
jgi:uncharacterized protein YlxW (UPF0749 family)